MYKLTDIYTTMAYIHMAEKYNALVTLKIQFLKSPGDDV